MRYILFLLIVVHGLIHLMGFTKAFKLAEISQLSQSMSRPAGSVWLICAVLFLASAFLFLLNKEFWWMLAVPAVITSQILIVFAWHDAKYGTLINIIILFPIIISFINAQPSSFRSQYKREVKNGLSRQIDMPLLSEVDLKNLPMPVQKYLRYTGSVGRPQVQNFRAKFTGSMRFEKDSKWMNFTAQQYDFFDEIERFFYIESTLYGIPFDGLHVYKGPKATMRIKVASLVQVADAKGSKMNQGETVTLFNDMCLIAPATLINKNIQWETINPTTVKANFTNQGNRVTAVLYFNDKGELINFISDDRFYSRDGKTYMNYRWSTPVKEYMETGGRRIPAYADAVWHTPEGDFFYAHFKVEELEYNCKDYK